MGAGVLEWPRAHRNCRSSPGGQQQLRLLARQN